MKKRKNTTRKAIETCSEQRGVDKQGWVARIWNIILVVQNGAGDASSARNAAPNLQVSVVDDGNDDDCDGKC